VAASTRGTFERLRSTYAYGVLSYEIFTVDDDLVQLVIEQALRDRFMEFHHDAVCFQDASGVVHEVRARTFEELHETIHRENRLRKPHNWRLPLRRTGKPIYFDGMLDSLLRWARGEGLLRGQRNRRQEPLLKAFRNYVAHGSGDHLVMPVDTARDFRDAAEIINQLWGWATPGGRLFPAPLQREVQIVAWSPSGNILRGPADHDLPTDQYPGWNCVLVRAVIHDDRLDRFDALYETTVYPCELLWGPGDWSDASAWLSQHNNEPDEVEVLDRLFAFQHHHDRLYMPRGLDVTAGLGEEDRHGRWHLIRAAFLTMRSPTLAQSLSASAARLEGHASNAPPRASALAPGRKSSTWPPAPVRRSRLASHPTSRSPRCTPCHATSTCKPDRTRNAAHAATTDRPGAILITHRSQVQILPPLLVSAGQRPGHQMVGGLS
jgi:hypothetical protein